MGSQPQRRATVLSPLSPGHARPSRAVLGRGQSKVLRVKCERPRMATVVSASSSRACVLRCPRAVVLALGEAVAVGRVTGRLTDPRRSHSSGTVWLPPVGSRHTPGGGSPWGVGSLVRVSVSSPVRGRRSGAHVCQEARPLGIRGLP